jgi:transcriptional regulator of acetoin/glycerol metabolism
MPRPRSSHDTREAYEPSRGDRATKPGLLVLYSAAHGQMPPAFVFRRDEVVIGRDGDVDVVVPDDAVSRRHATIRKSDDGFTVVDHGSRNGTLVDGVRVERAALRHRVRVRVGDAVFAFVDDAEPYLPYALDGMVRGAPPDDVPELVGGLHMRTLARETGRVAPTDLTCVVYGETGTGKELVARALHRLSGRAGALVAINCAAIPAQLFESELFGYKRGAFSGAERDKPGLVHGAHGGTLFLDEIGEMPIEMQAKLLRLLQQREVMPVGAARAENVDVRIIAATHRPLAERVSSGTFRGDLLARLEEHAFVVPPLRDRKEDIFSLATSFVRKHAGRPLALTFEVMDALLAYDWPFNVRELESAVKRAAVLAEGTSIARAHLPPALLRPSAAPPPPSPNDLDLDDDEFHRGAPKESHLRGLLSQHEGNIAAVARALGKRRMQVQRWMQKYAIPPSEYRKGRAPAADDQD